MAGQAAAAGFLKACAALQGRPVTAGASAVRELACATGRALAWQPQHDQGDCSSSGGCGGAPGARSLATSASMLQPSGSGSEVLKKQKPKSKVYTRENYERLKQAEWGARAAAPLALGGQPALAQPQQQQHQNAQRRRGPPGPPRGPPAPPRAAVLHAQRLLSQASSLYELRGVLAGYGHCLDAIALAAAVTRVPKVMAGRRGQPDIAGAAQLLRRLVPRLLDALPVLGTRELCNALWAMARAGYDPGADAVTAIVDRLLLSPARGGGGASTSSSTNTAPPLADARDSELGMLAVGAAALAPRHDALWQAIGGAGAERAAAGAGALDGQAAANLAWSLARAGRADDGVLTAALLGYIAAPGVAGNLKPIELANFSWALASLAIGGSGSGSSAAAVRSPAGAAALDALAGAAAPRLASFHALELRNLLWALGKMRHAHAGLAAAAAEHIGGAAERAAALSSGPRAAGGATTAAPLLLSSNLLAIAAWAVARCAGTPSGNAAAASNANAAEAASSVVAAAAAALAADPSTFNAQDAANTVWAAARVGHGGPAWWRAAARALDGRLSNFRAMELAMLALSFARRPGGGGVSASGGGNDAALTRLFDAVGVEAASRPEQFAPLDAAHVLRAFEEAGHVGRGAAAAGAALAAALEPVARAGAIGSARQLEQIVSGLRHVGAPHEALVAAAAASSASAVSR